MLDFFIRQFTDKKIRYIQNGKQFFLENKHLETYRLPYPEDIFGVYLGREKNNTFYPSFSLLDILARISDEKIIVTDLGEIDFLFGKNLRKKHIRSIYGKQDSRCLKLVQNMHNENIGYGELVQPAQGSTQILKHILDRGVFLHWDKKPEI